MEPNARHFAEGALLLTVDRSIATLTLNRSHCRNAINSPMWRALPNALADAKADQGVKVLVVRGSRTDFAAGADIAEFERVFADRSTTSDYARAMTFPKPSIAMIEGHCIGAGVALALACDIRCASTDARFGVTPARLAMIYSLGDTVRLVRTVGRSRASDLLFTGRLFGAAEALSMQLVDELHASPELASAVSQKAALIASRSAWSVQTTKKVLDLVESGVSSDTDVTRAWFSDAVERAEFLESLKAFFQRGTQP
jgi:enoyl-CoA hydratase/carnithine racemase